MRATAAISPLSTLMRVSISLHTGLLLVQAADTNIIGWRWSSSTLETNAPQMNTNVIALAGSDWHCVALLADRTVQAWGQNNFGATTVPADATNAIGIAAGTYHGLAARADGTVSMWGRFPSLLRYVPVEATNVVALGIGRGAQHALALRGDGTVVDWGHVATTNIPKTAFNIVSVAAGSWHSLAVRADGRVVAWGDTSNGKTTVPAAATNIVAVAAGEQNSVAVRADGTIIQWGSISPFPTSATNVIEVGCFQMDGAVALKRDGTVVGWGAPVTISATNIMAIGADSWGALAVKAAGPPIFPFPAARRVVATGQSAFLRQRPVGALPLIYQWSFYGTNLPGATKEVLAITNATPDQNGFYSLVASNALGVTTNAGIELLVVPIIIETQPTNQTVYVGASPTFTVGALGQSPRYQWFHNGIAISWATNKSVTLTNAQASDAGGYSVGVSNQFGGIVSSNADLAVWPILVTQPPQDQVIFHGGTASFGLTAQASTPLAYQWQFNGSDLSGQTSSTLVLTNTQFDQAGAYRVIATSADAAVTNACSLAVVPVAAWGSATYGRTNVPPDLTNIVALAAGSIHNLALLNNGTVRAWWLDFGRTNVPADLTNAVAISAGDWGSLALRADGRVAAWGLNNSAGQTNVPSQLTNTIAVATGGYHCLALQADRTVVAWGSNTSGQTNVPANLTNVIAIAAGSDSSVALTAEGRVVAWGYNGSGQTNVPAGLSNVVAIAMGSIHAFALKSDGTLSVWGATNSYGLGNIPASATNVVSIGAGYGHCLALKDDGMVLAWGYPYNGETNIPSGLQAVSAVSCGDSHNLALVGGAPFGPKVFVTQPGRSNGGFSVNVPSQSGRVYRLEHKDSLTDSNWIAHRLVAGTGSPITLTDSTATGDTRFYRVRRW